jgi:hypothetical protein
MSSKNPKPTVPVATEVHGRDYPNTAIRISPNGLELNTALLPTGDLHGYADACALRISPRSFDITFLDSSSDRALARIAIARGSVSRSLLENNKAFRADAVTWLGTQKVALQPASLARKSRADDPPPLPANIVRMARQDHDTEVEFYFMSYGAAAGLKNATGAASLPFLPVARVCIPINVIVGLFNQLSEAEATDA